MIDKNDIELLKGVFVTREECGNKSDTFDSKLGKDNVRLSVIENQLSTITRLLWLAVGGIVAVVVDMIFSNIH